MFSRSIVELGFHHFHHIYLHTCTSWFDCMTHSSLDLRFDFTIYALQVCIRCLHTYELHISLSCRKREKTRHHYFFSLVRSINTIYWETWECHTMESLSFILKTYKNSRTMVEQGTWDIVLDLIVPSINCSRPKWKLTSPIEFESNMGEFER
jgi:hypothetical protein